MKQFGALIAVLLLTSTLNPVSIAYAQSPVTVVGPAPVPGNCTKFFSTTQIQDAGTTCNGGSGSSPGGSNGQVQFNNSGVFGGLTDTQVTTRIQSFTNSLSGAAPSSGGGTVNFLRADGTWAAPPGTPSPFVTPQQFGAACNGSTDDTTALQSAMSSTLPMFVPPGSNCLFSSELDYSGTSTKEVFSSGRTNTSLTMTNATQNGLVRTNGNFHIHDITITTNVSKSAGAAILMKGPLNNNAGDLIMNCNILGGPSTPIFTGIDNETDVIPAIIDNYILSAKNVGIILNSVVSGSGNGGESLILGNTFNTVLTAGNNATALLFQSGQLTIKIANNTFEDYDFGIVLSVPNGGVVNAIITANAFENNLLGVFASPTGTASMDALIINDNYFDPATTGFSVLLAGASNWINKTNIVGNSFTYQADGTIHLAAGVTALVGSNTFNTGSNTAAIVVDAGFPSGQAFIHDNVFNNSSAPLTLNSNPVTVAKNNLGYNPVGVTSTSPGASPWTYKSSSSPETLVMAATTSISSITRGGVQILPTVPGPNVAFTMDVDALDTIIITYSGTLFMNKYVH